MLVTGSFHTVGDVMQRSARTSEVGCRATRDPVYVPPMQTKALPGFRDFYPADLALRAHIFRTWRTVAARYGFEEYDGPPLEPLELYTAKSGDEIVGQLYNFTDKGGREVALRPEMTPTLARMVAARANGLKKPIRWFSIPQLFRYERQQRGRLREHFQLNCDIIGEPGPLGDAEMIALAVDVMRAFGLGPADVRVRLSDRRLLARCCGRRRAEAQAAGRRTRRSTSSSAVRADDLGSSAAPEAGVADHAIERARDRRAARDAGGSSGAAGARRRPEAGAAAPAGWSDALEAMGLGEFVEVDLTIVRGLAYYTGIVFELFDASGELRAICGGGRYDKLLQRSAAWTCPRSASAWATWCSAELLRDRGLVPADGVEHRRVPRRRSPRTTCPTCSRSAHELRDAGLRVEYALGPRQWASSSSWPTPRSARLAVVIGPDDGRGAR